MMPDFRVADTAPEHPKLRAAGLPAAGLWALAGAYAMRELTDGWVPAYWVQTWPSGKKHATALIAVGLWRREPKHGLPGYQFRDWTDYQRSAASVQREREEGRQRARRSRESRKGSGERSGEASPLAGADVRSESHDSRALTRALTQEGSVRGETSGNEREQPRNAPRSRCPQHAELPPDQRIPPCGACKQLRIDAEQQAADQHKRELTERRDWREQVDACHLCDHNGKRELDDGRMATCTHHTLEVAS